MNRRMIKCMILAIFLFTPGCLSSNQSTNLDSNESTITITVWHSFAAESKEQATFESKIEAFMSSNPGVEVKISAIPCSDAKVKILVNAGNSLSLKS